MSTNGHKRYRTQRSLNLQFVADELARTGSPPSGICTICGCTGSNPCIDDVGCCCEWLDEDETCCTTASCRDAWLRGQGREA
jgi:hypothetical protein